MVPPAEKLAATAPQPPRAPSPADPSTRPPEPRLSCRLLGRLVFWGVVLRLLLFATLPRSLLDSVIANRVELVTPLTSFKRLTEGLFLIQNGIPPYDGDMVHQLPLILAFFHSLLKFGSATVVLVPLVYSLVDGVIAQRLARIAEAKLEIYKSRPRLWLPVGEVKDGADVESTLESYVSPPVVAGLYLFNPMTILTCLSRSTLVFSNLAVVLALHYATKGNRMKSMFWLAAASYLSFYPVMLIIPAVMLLQMGHHSRYSIAPAIVPVTAFSIFAGLLLLASFLLVGSWQFMPKTYGLILFVTDLTPNIGLFWYYFIEVFDQFRSFFLAVFQLHAFAYGAPLAVKLHRDPLFVATLLLGVIATFKSYPAVGDTALFLGFLPVWYENFKYMRYGYLVFSIYLYVAVLFPACWYIWIYQGSGNANFVYAFTLLYGIGQVILVVDSLYAHLRRQWDVDRFVEVNGDIREFVKRSWVMVRQV